MNWSLHASIKKANNLSSPVQFPLPRPPPPPPPPSYDTTFQSKISPSILLIILILAVIFFISGLLHLLVRFLLRPTTQEPEDLDNATAFQGQLQQLFHLHDAGVDQAFIDTLPVFLYRSIVGGRAAAAAKDPFDCAVCLCEFGPDDRLRLLPKCSHAFHVECIDTWLLSHSTCPLCRRSLLSDFSPYGNCSPVVFVLESASESSREIAVPSERMEAASVAHLGLVVEEELGDARNGNAEKNGEIGGKDEVASVNVTDASSEAKLVPVKLGKFRNVEANGGGIVEGNCSNSGVVTASNPGLDQRRCFSMGSYEYVMDESSLLQVAVQPGKKRSALAARKPGHGVAMSECDCHSKREGFRGFDAPPKVFVAGNSCGSEDGNAGIRKKESFSISKIWLRGKKDRPGGSKRASSFRLPLQRATSDESKKNKGDVSPVTESEYNVSAWEKSDKSGSLADWDVETGSLNNALSSRADEAPSFARRTLLWIMGWQTRTEGYL